MIYFFQPQQVDGSLGKGYNRYMELLPGDDDWAVITDHDTMFLTPDTDEIIQRAIKQYPGTGIFTCYTNRVGNRTQCWNGDMSEDSNLLSHRVKALKVRQTNWWKCIDIDKEISGMFMVIQKKTWKKHKFSEEPGFLGIDNKYSRDVLGSGLKIKLITGLYILHYYRLLEGAKNTAHLR